MITASKFLDLTKLCSDETIVKMSDFKKEYALKNLNDSIIVGNVTLDSDSFRFPQKKNDKPLSLKDLRKDLLSLGNEKLYIHDEEGMSLDGQFDLNEVVMLPELIIIF